MKHAKSWTFDQVLKVKTAFYGDPKEIRVGTRDLSITDAEDQENIRFRKGPRGLEICVYSRKQTFKEGKFVKCDLGHRHPKTVNTSWCWMTMTLTPEMTGQLLAWLTDGHHKWRLK